MYEAVVLFWIGFIYAAAVCFASMGVAILFGQILDAITVGHIIILIVFCGGGLGVVGWVRHRWPTILVGVNCSLAALSSKFRLSKHVRAAINLLFQQS